MGEINTYSLSRWRKGGQASNEDLFPLGYGEWDRVRVRVKLEITNPNKNRCNRNIVGLLQFRGV
ncbi:MAG: hypothetical protein MUO89_04175 [Dehalococcoidia bacterium]|nr:hypothetical protein [Dehalococcoidia bacterium]